MSQPESHSIEVQSYDGACLSVRYFGDLMHRMHTYVCVAGLGGTSTAWDVFASQILEQTPEVLIIAIDMRGHNTSSKIFPPLDTDIFKTLAQDIQAVCTSLNLVNPILIGHSLGGIIVLSYLKHAFTPLPEMIFILNTPSYSTFVPPLLHKPLYRLLQRCSKNDCVQRPIFTPEMHARFKNSWDFSPRRIYHDMLCMGVVRFFLLWFVTLSAPPQKYSYTLASNIYCVLGKKDLIVQAKNAQKLKGFFPNTHWFFVDTNHNSIVNEPEAIAHYVLAARASA